MKKPFRPLSSTFSFLLFKAKKRISPSQANPKHYMALKRAAYTRLRWNISFGTGLLERVGTGIVGTIGYVVLPTGVSTDVSRDIV